MPAMLEVRNLEKYFRVGGGTLHAVDGITFDLNKGKTLGVVGESGCGKSTLGRTILHLIEPTGGQVFFNGRDITNPGKKELKELREDMQIIFQDPYSSLNPRMSVCEAIMEPLLLQRKLSKEECHAEALKLMDTVGLAKRFENSYPHELDGGRRQRIGIARALALKPKFIVCDEPVSALDVSIQAQIINLMLDLQEEMKLAYMFVTHDLSVVKYSIGRHHGDVPWTDGGKSPGKGALSKSNAPVHKGPPVRHTDTGQAPCKKPHFDAGGDYLSD